MNEIVKNSLSDFRVSYKKYLFFGLLYMLFTSFLFVPLISFIFDRMLRILGNGSLLNSDVYKIGLSTTGLIGMLVIGFLAVIVIFIELGVMIIIAQQRYFGRGILVTNALITTIMKLPKLLGFGFLQLVFFSLLVVPFIDFSFYMALLDFNLPIYVTNWFYGSSHSVIALYLFWIVVAIYFFIRLIFTLHFFFTNKKNVWESIKCSWLLTKYNKLKIIYHLCLVNIGVFLLWFLIVDLLSYLPKVTKLMMLGDFINNYLITISSYMTIIFSLLFIPINIIIVTRLKYRFLENRGEVIEDQLKVYGNWSLISLERRLIHFFKKRKYTLRTVILLTLTAVFVLNYTLNSNFVYLKWNVQVAAHRGDSAYAPENSLSGIRSAVEKGVDAVEIDVMLTKDGVVILNHDPTFQRVAGNPNKVKDMNYEEIADIDIGLLFSGEFVGEKVPTLAQVFEEIRQYPVKLIIDLKPSDTSGELATKVVELIEDYEMEEVVYVQAFDYRSLQLIRKKNSNIKIGQILFLYVGDLSRLDVDFYTIRQTMLSERFITNARKQNREVWVWTVNIDRNIKEVLKYNIDGIITDYPSRVQSAIGIDFGRDNSRTE